MDIKNTTSTTFENFLRKAKGKRIMIRIFSSHPNLTNVYVETTAQALKDMRNDLQASYSDIKLIEYNDYGGDYNTTAMIWINDIIVK